MVFPGNGDVIIRWKLYLIFCGKIFQVRFDSRAQRDSLFTSGKGAAMFDFAGDQDLFGSGRGRTSLHFIQQSVYLSTDPDMRDRPWPVEIGIATFLQVAAHKLTDKQVYLDRAKHFADLGISTYWSGDNPLPKADPGCKHYENITRADTLAYALLKIHAIEKSLPVKIDISDIDR
ncbi:MAG: hypothetical protein U9N87_05435 [Planctomycetota bacterium]|nr:hypothetical protein [Planctomycetota bacterium]